MKATFFCGVIEKLGYVAGQHFLAAIAATDKERIRKAEKACTEESKERRKNKKNRRRQEKKMQPLSKKAQHTRQEHLTLMGLFCGFQEELHSRMQKKPRKCRKCGHAMKRHKRGQACPSQTDQAI